MPGPGGVGRLLSARSTPAVGCGTWPVSRLAWSRQPADGSPGYGRDDPEVEEIWINEPGKVFVAKAGQPRLTTTVLDEQQVHDLVELMVARRRPGRPGRPPPRWGTEGAWVLPCGRPSLVDGLTQPYRTTQSRRKPAAGRHRRTPPRCSAGRPMGG